MATVRTLIGYVKGPKGDTGATGATGPQGPAGQDGAPGVSDYATTEAAGLVRVGDDFNVNSSNGVLSIKNAFTRASALAKMVTDEAFATTLGKIAKAVDWVVDNAPNFFNKSTDIVDGFDSALTDKALSANAGKTLKTSIDSLNDSFNGVISSGSTITSLNSATETGFYTIMNSAANKPVSGLAFGYVLVNRGSEGSVIQTVIGRAADNVTVFHFERFSSNGGSSWGAWLACIAQKIETTINVPAIAASGSAQVTLTGYGRSIIPHAIIVRDNKSGRPMIASNWWANGNGLEIIIFNLGAARDAGNVTLEIIF